MEWKLVTLSPVSKSLEPFLVQYGWTEVVVSVSNREYSSSKFTSIPNLIQALAKNAKKRKKIPNGVEIIFRNKYSAAAGDVTLKNKLHVAKPNDVQKITSGEKDTVSSVLIVYPFHCNGKIIIRAFTHMRA